MILRTVFMEHQNLTPFEIQNVLYSSKVVDYSFTKLFSENKMPQFTVEQRGRIIQLFNESGCVTAARQATAEFGRTVSRLRVRRLVIKLNTGFCFITRIPK